MFVASDYPIDRHYVDNPDELFDKPIRELVIDTESEVLIEAHLQCAGQEMPLSLDDEKYFGPLFKKLCETKLVKDQDGWCVRHDLRLYRSDARAPQVPHTSQVFAPSREAYHVTRCERG